MIPATNMDCAAGGRLLSPVRNVARGGWRAGYSPSQPQPPRRLNSVATNTERRSHSPGRALHVPELHGLAQAVTAGRDRHPTKTSMAAGRTRQGKAPRPVCSRVRNLGRCHAFEKNTRDGIGTRIGTASAPPSRRQRHGRRRASERTARTTHEAQAGQISTGRACAGVRSSTVEPPVRSGSILLVRPAGSYAGSTPAGPFP